MLEFLTSSGIAHLIETHGLWILFLVVMLESAGVPLPGETALLATAVYAGTTHRIDLVWIVVVASAAAVIGDNLGYLVGRTLGVRLLKRYGGYVHLTESKLRIGQYLFLKHGGKIVFFGRFVAFLRIFAALLAGANRMDWRRFFLMNLLGGVCWATLLGGGAYFLGHQMQQIAGPASLILFGVAISLVIAGFVMLRRHEKMLEARAEAALAAHGMPAI